MSTKMIETRCCNRCERTIRPTRRHVEGAWRAVAIFAAARMAAPTTTLPAPTSFDYERQETDLCGGCIRTVLRFVDRIASKRAKPWHEAAPAPEVGS